MRYTVTVAAAASAILAAAAIFSGPVHAGTCQAVRAKGFAETLAKATLYAQADLKQTAKSMKGKVTQATTKCDRIMGHFHCTIDAVICPKK